MVPSIIPPSISPSAPPTIVPSTSPSISPSMVPSIIPSSIPSYPPSMSPSDSPTIVPSMIPSMIPTYTPSTSPSNPPTGDPSISPSLVPSIFPSMVPSNTPSLSPSDAPTDDPSISPSAVPSLVPSMRSSYIPSYTPSVSPSNLPTGNPSMRASLVPSLRLTPFSTAFSFSPTLFSISCYSNLSSWKEVLFLFGSYSADVQSSMVLDVSPTSYSPSLLVYGSKAISSFGTINTSCLSSCHYPVAQISASYRRDTTSRSAVIPGDLNGDGFNDLIVCSPLSSSCNIFFGKKEDGLRNVMIGVTIYGPSLPLSSSSQPFFGFAVSGAEDVNEDGLVDVLISALTGRACYVIYGRRSWPSVIRVSEMSSGEDGYQIVADSSTTLTGISVAGIGDMNGDGRSDLALSVQRGGLFMVYVVWGEGGVGKDVVLADINNGGSRKGFIVIGEQGYYTGLSISGVGDVNGDGIRDMVIGAIPYPDRAKIRDQKSYVILGSSSSSSSLSSEDIELEGFEGRGVVSIVGGGFLVSGVGDVNDDGIDDILITDMRDYLNKGNAYIISYPRKMNSAPSFIPSSFPSSAPSHCPSSQPSSSSPSYSSSLSPHNDPNQPTTQRPSRSSLNPTNSIKTIIPTTTPTTILPTTPTRTPSLRPTTIQSNSPSIQPSRIPSCLISFSPSLSPSSSSSVLLLPSSEYRVKPVNSSQGIVYGVEGANERFEISSMSSDGRRSSGWSGTIIGGRGSKVYVIYPKDPSQPVNRIIIQDFDRGTDVIDLSHISQVASKAEVPYLTNPLTLFLPHNQKIVVSTLEDLSDENFIFQSESSSSSSTSSGVLVGAVSTVVALSSLLGLVVISYCAFIVIDHRNIKKEKEEVMEYYQHENQESEIIVVEKKNNNKHENDDDDDDDDDESINSCEVQEQVNYIAFTQQSFSTIESINNSNDVIMNSDGESSESSNSLTVLSRSYQNADESHSMKSWQLSEMFSLDEDEDGDDEE